MALSFPFKLVLFLVLSGGTSLSTCSSNSSLCGLRKLGQLVADCLEDVVGMSCEGDFSRSVSSPLGLAEESGDNSAGVSHSDSNLVNSEAELAVLEVPLPFDALAAACARICKKNPPDLAVVPSSPMASPSQPFSLPKINLVV